MITSDMSDNDIKINLEGRRKREMMKKEKQNNKNIFLKFISKISKKG